ncbi:16S rRNA (adenine(1518)-N(6)/adenine(1519)-N(6))-dimethyltransferase RsmA [Blattabacterium cuenoti]|uniref:16S rRNA (adenine(1518)-N(6)/adenine(1519)-N(6))- dimethyltransferase RsmA n=1 Tax=Blattabacterium cuenoti TaxID=1653831 RepID=UPI00163C7724|nr:16S rRNA (adenine(1518)-N(6)/adenine(1519)-N(6))-dimethyltransferase RsmA [Blattabacterium cuenoti]
MHNKYFYKRKLDQFFLKNKNIAKKIVDNLSFENYSTVVEVGPGLGILTEYLLLLEKKRIFKKLFLIEIDKEIIFFLKNLFSISDNKIIHKDFLKWNPKDIPLYNFAIISNFPYGISSKILFHILKYSQYIPECIGMFQEELVNRIFSKKGNKKYGILSVLIQTFYEIKYLFKVDKKFFFPVPKIKSAVISLKRKKLKIPNYRKKLLFKCVKIAFRQRRKKLKNSLELFNKYSNFNKISFLNKRAEELNYKEFLQIIQEIEIIK